MIKAFLSHSSKDKTEYVKKVAIALGRDNINYDEFTFEEGEKNLDEILRGLLESELFVIFLSKNSLQSEWVKREINEAKDRFDSNYIHKILPIVIDDDIKYTDPRIPDWISENYNLRPIKRPSVAARRIHTSLRQLSWSRHPSLQEKSSVFVGRTEKLNEFEERVHDFDQDKPTTIITSGLPGVGRRTFMHNASQKAGIYKKQTKPSSIILDRNVSIEDFILKLNDLGLIDLEESLFNLTEKPVFEKIKIIHQIMDACYKAKEAIYIVDDGCIINYKREVSDWFLDSIKKYEKTNFPIFFISSKYKVHFKHRPRSSNFFFIELNELSHTERKMLLKRVLEVFEVEINRESFNDVSELLHGFPDQVFYAVDLLKRNPETRVLDKLPLIAEYNSDKASALLRKYENDESYLDFIRLLAQFEVISSDFIFQIFSESQYYPMLEQLAAEHIVELIGFDSEIIRLNDIIRDYIKRNRIKLKPEIKVKITAAVSKIISEDDLFERDSSELIFSMKETLKSGNKIDEKYLIPSHYLRCMKDLYYNRGSMKRIVELADKILEKEANLERSVIQDIRYYLCLALAKMRDTRMLKEVQRIKGDEHNFLLGYFYRLSGRYKDALERLEQIVDAKFVDARAKREIVQVYVQMEEYTEALAYARQNYEENKGNQFHTQAYFNCLINSEEATKSSKELLRLIENLRDIDSEQSNEMADIADSLYEAKINNDETAAFDKINDAMAKHSENHYPVLTFCDISMKYKKVEMLRKGISELEDLSKKSQIAMRSINRYKAFLKAMEGDYPAALAIIEKDISRFPPKSRERTLEKLRMLAQS